MKTYDGEVEDVEVASVIEVLRTAPIRVKEVTNSGWGMKYTDPEIFYKGEWLYLCRTDLCDDVCTGLCATKTAEGWRTHYLSSAEAALGVRIGPKRFAIIDQATDG